jgi:hypothetical protein
MTQNEKANSARGESLSTFVASLVLAAVAPMVQIVLSVLLQRRSYSTYARPKPRAVQGLRSYIRLIAFPLPLPTLRQPSDFNEYLFERHLHTIMRIFGPLAIVLPAILIPLNALEGKGVQGGISGLDQLSFENVGYSHTSRYWAHLTMAIGVVLYVCSIIVFELRFFKRIEPLILRAQGVTATPNTILIVSHPDAPLSLDAVRRQLGGIQRAVVPLDLRKPLELLQQRNDLVTQLEIAETSLIKSIVQQKSARLHKYMQNLRDRNAMPLREPFDSPLARTVSPVAIEFSDDCEINHLRNEISRLDTEMKFEQGQNRLLEHVVLVQLSETTEVEWIKLRSKLPSSWTIKFVTSLDDIIWNNVHLTWWQTLTRSIISYGVFSCLLVAFAFPVSITGFLSELSSIARVSAWLVWLDKLPTWLIATAQATLPTCLLTGAMAIIPLSVRIIADIRGLHSRQAVECLVQKLYFTFLFTQISLLASLSAGLSTALQALLQQAKTVPIILAQNLPKASNYFSSYIILQAVAASTSAVSQLTALFNMVVVSPLLDHSPRQRWMRQEKQKLQRLGTFVPGYTNLACIGTLFFISASQVKFSETDTHSFDLFCHITFDCYIQCYFVTGLMASL